MPARSMSATLCCLAFGFLPAASGASAARGFQAAGGLSALQTAYYVKRNALDNGRGEKSGDSASQASCDEASNEKAMRAMALRVRYLEELATKQHNRLSAVQVELTGKELAAEKR